LKNKNAGDHSQEKTTEKTILRLSLACTFLHSLGQSRHFALRKNSEAILGTPQVTASFTGLLGSTALERRLFCDPSSSIEYDAVTNPYCSRRSDNGIYPSAWVLAEIADLLPIVSNECPKNIRILG